MTFSATTHWLRRSAAHDPGAIALVSDGSALSYAQLATAAARWSDRLDAELDLEGAGHIGVVADRTTTAVAQLWAVWESPHTAVLLESGSALVGDDEQLAAWGLAGVVDGDTLRPLPAAPQLPAEPAHSWVLTSGSTGMPRPVVLTNENVAAAVAASQARLGNTAVDRWLSALPLSHIGGASVLWRSAAAGGTTILDEQFDAARSVRWLERGDVTFTSVVPTILQRVLDHGVAPHANLKVVLVGGAAARKGLIERALAAGLPVVTTYGLTEACSQVATVAPGDMPASLGTAGRPLEGMDVTIIDADAGGVGVIAVDGPAVSSGYAGEPPRRGPHRTGDLGSVDEAGRLVVVGRTDDVIISGGENVAPALVEAALEAHPLVERAAVVGVPDDEWGSVVAAMVVAAAGVSAADLAEHARTSLRPAERPKHYRLVAALPLLSNGKLDRNAVLTALIGERR